MTETLERMPAESVSMFTPPFGRWHGGAVWKYDNAAQVWVRGPDYPEDQLDSAQQLMLARTRARVQGDSVNIEVHKDGEVVYSGPWKGAPAPVAAYIDAAAKHHGIAELPAYLEKKGTPIALAMQGYGLRLLTPTE